MDLYDEIYYSLIGALTSEAALPWVNNAFGEGSECAASYDRLVEARNKVLEALGQDENPDLDTMLAEMDRIQYALCHQIIMLRNM